ncbi:tetratricopeptide repeat protein [Prochlorococcus marinus]|uniref:Uncharacterized protein n=1 Tax=Prochlorococcus marinus XMU1408 TaxID=2213228 RepID=A0A318R0W4_PROMR|nr:tetratricopeptide repeat protein [Prochlorococcus marinus]MBW3042347.1 hypothetical protein [Prochlorococcus marinus str. XMU1408]PYE01089.1 hypothetical protein DNJ73_06550 [Prochlorococcus marinus XMU1408]
MEEVSPKGNQIDIPCTETITIPIPIAQKEIKTYLSTKTAKKLSKEQLITQTYKDLLEGNITVTDAEKYYQDLISEGLNDHRIFFYYGSVLQILGKLKEAEISYLKAIELNPTFANTHANLGVIFKTQGKLEQAEISCLKAIELNPTFANAYVNLGNIFREVKKHEEAIKSYLKAIELNPTFAEAHSNLGVLLIDLDKLEKAELSFRKAIEHKPDLADAHYNLGVILRKLEKSKEAKLSFQKTIDLKPNFSAAHYNLGILYNLEGKYKDASYSFRLALADDFMPNHIRYHLANALENEAKYLSSQAFEKSDIRAIHELENQKLSKYKKKNIIINEGLILKLNKISKSINCLYGFNGFGSHAINSGPCGIFACLFFLQWNSRFINEVKIGFKILKTSNQCDHIFILLPNNQLFDGGLGVHRSNIYKVKDTKLIIMKKYNLNLLDKYSYGLIREYGHSCPNFSISKTTETIAKHLDEVYYG